MDLWLAGPETRKLLEKAVAEWHPHLADILEKIAIIMRDPASKSGGVVCLGTSKKASPMIRALGKEDYIFILEIAADEWQTLSDDQRMALIDHLLCQCGAEEDEKKGTISYTILKPEIQLFKANLRRFGVWMDISDEEDDGDHATTTIEGMFSREAVAKRKYGDPQVTLEAAGKSVTVTAEQLRSLPRKLPKLTADQEQLRPQTASEDSSDSEAVSEDIRDVTFADLKSGKVRIENGRVRRTSKS